MLEVCGIHARLWAEMWLQAAKAYWLAAWHLARRGRFLALAGGARGAVSALWRKPTELTERRTRACRLCEMYYEPLGTCGEPGHTVDGQPVGCWCYVALANRLPDKDCWARARGLEAGWPDDLRP